MALPPTVPTSFVPRPAASSVTRRSNFTGAFAFFGYGVLTIVIALAIGAFIYSQILATVRYKSLHIARDDAGLIKLEASGVAKSFNALAATSDAFAGDGRVKDAIFSAIRVEGNVVNFSLSASIDPELVAFAPTASSTLPTTPPPPRASTTTP